jgi:hypothetical protein
MSLPINVACKFCDKYYQEYDNSMNWCPSCEFNIDYGTPQSCSQCNETPTIVIEATEIHALMPCLTYTYTMCDVHDEMTKDNDVVIIHNRFPVPHFNGKEWVGYIKNSPRRELQYHHIRTVDKVQQDDTATVYVPKAEPRAGPPLATYLIAIRFVNMPGHMTVVYSESTDDNKLYTLVGVVQFLATNLGHIRNNKFINGGTTKVGPNDDIPAIKVITNCSLIKVAHDRFTKRSEDYPFYPYISFEREPVSNDKFLERYKRDNEIRFPSEFVPSSVYLKNLTTSQTIMVSEVDGY